MKSLLWAIFLACSWTWCIGMYLPVLLVRDYGIWGWVVFAIPNVIGAAAMAWTVASPAASQQLIAAHNSAARWFSAVTVGFQVYFASWFLLSLWLGPSASFPLIAAILWIVTLHSDRRTLLCAVIVFVISIACLLMGLAMHALPSPPARPPSFDLLPLAAVCLFGFALCPYLDLTFHRARQSLLSRSHARVAFGIGFGVFFLTMILFTLAYSGLLVLHDSMRPTLRWILLIHMSFQLALTVALHLRELKQTIDFTYPTLAVIFVSTLAALLPLQGWVFRGIHAGEFVYRCFMGFYGLVFPAYVWLCMIPTWRDPAKPSPRSLALFAGAVSLASPFYYLGFIEQKLIWLLPGLAIVLLARLVVPRTASAT